MSFQISNLSFLFLGQDGLVNIRRRFVGHIAHLIDRLYSTIRLSRKLMLHAAYRKAHLSGAGFLFIGDIDFGSLGVLRHRGYLWTGIPLGTDASITASNLYTQQSQGQVIESGTFVTHLGNELAFGIAVADFGIQTGNGWTSRFGCTPKHSTVITTYGSLAVTGSPIGRILPRATNGHPPHDPISK